MSASFVGDSISTEGMSTSKSAAISTLVQQLRDGVITRAELFDKLTRLHRGESAVDVGGPDDVSVASVNPGGDRQQYDGRREYVMAGTRVGGGISPVVQRWGERVM